MVKPSKGTRHRTRKLLRKSVRERGGVPPLSLLMIEYKVGDKVALIANPAIHAGMPHRRYHGLTGTVVGRRGRAYEVKVELGGKKKILFVRPEHLRPLNRLLGH
ncbi:MAG: 50S ribosomal protein L21e [Fervidicoccaceae archaeon]